MAKNRRKPKPGKQRNLGLPKAILKISKQTKLGLPKQVIKRRRRKR